MIDVNILAEELGGRAFKGTIDKRERLNLKTVRLAAPGQASFKRNVIYVIDSSEAQVNLQCATGAAFAITGTPVDLGEEALADRLELTDGRSSAEALEQIQGVFERFEAMSDRATTAAIEGRPIDAVLDPLSGALKNPFALFDSTSMFIGKAGRVNMAESDEIWQAAFDEGYPPVQNLERSQIQQMRTRDEPFISEYNTTTTMNVGLKINGELVGALGCTQIAAPFTEGQVSAMHWIKLLLEKLWPLLSSRTELAGISDQLILQLINRLNVSLDLVERFLAGRGWRMDDAYTVLTLFQPDGTFYTMDIEHLRHLITSISPMAVIIEVHDGLLAVLHEPSNPPEDAKGALISFMEKRGLQMTVGSEVHSFLDLWKAYEQCRAARAVATEQDGAVVPFGAVCGRYLLHALDASTDLEALCHPKVAAMAERPRGEEFVHSLRLYLINGRSLTRAANALCVHRNTLIYRIEKIEEMLGADLSDADEDQLLYLYFSCLVVERGMDGRKTSA